MTAAAFHRVSAAIHAASQPEQPALSANGAGELLPLSPWAMWLLLALIRHQERQRWVGRIVEARLGVNLADLSAAGNLLRLPVKEAGLVPGQPEWEYLFHGPGCCLTHRVTGESIDVDFYNASADWVDQFFFIGFLKSLTQAAPVERRLIELHPHLESLSIAFDELCDAGFGEFRDGRRTMRLSPATDGLLAAVERINTIGADPRLAPHVCRHLGDHLPSKHWPSLDNAPDVSLASRTKRLARLFADPKSRRVALLAFSDLGGREADDALRAALKEPASGVLSAALTLAASSAVDWTADVRAALLRIDNNGAIPSPYCWLSAAAYLLRNNTARSEIERGLLSMQKRELGDAALLALEHFPVHARMIFRRALRSSVPIDRTTAAAALAILQEPWAIAELASVLNESTEQAATSECRAALLAISDTAAHKLVFDWEARNPHERPIGPFIPIEDAMLANRNGWLQHEMAKLHDRVLPLRGRHSPTLERKRRWWPF
ncbi:MAG: hypothetical protein QM783_02115 [Phycisphaerales bacterium]